MRVNTTLLSFVAIALVGGVTSGCGKDAPSAVGEGETGTLRMPLTSAGPAGVSYRLANATFQISNFATGFTTTASGDVPTLVVDLPPSTFSFDYQIFLQDGWTLYEVGPGGDEHALNATVLNSYQYFTIKPQRTTPLLYQFKAGSLVVTIGDGMLAVNISVDDTLIDDFEDGDGVLPSIGGRHGRWLTFNDTTGTQTPAVGSPVVPEVVSADASYVLHETGSNFAVQGPLPDGTFAFGAGVGVNLKQDDATGMVSPYDASAYDGFSFNFRYAFPNNVVPLQVLGFYVGTSATTPVAEGGTCVDNCYDDYAYIGSVPFSPLYFSGFLPWSVLRQQGFGTPVAFDPATIISLKWIVQFPDFGQPITANTFDFQLDNVVFMKTPPLVNGNSNSALAASAWQPSKLGAGQRSR